MENACGQRAVDARRRAGEAQKRISELRRRREDAEIPTPAQYQEHLRAAMAHAEAAYDHLLSALEASALAHERASARYMQQADGNPVIEAKARGHLESAEADRARALRLRDS